MPDPDAVGARHTVRSTLTWSRQAGTMLSAPVGPLQFDLLVTAAAHVPELRSANRLPATDLEVDVFWERNQPYLVVDHRSDVDSRVPARVELWQSAGRPETDIAYLLVLADSRDVGVPASVVAADSLSALVDTLLVRRDGC